MGETSDSENREQQDLLRAALRDTLLARGSATQHLSNLSVPVELWRKVARMVGRDLRRPIRTLVSDGSVHAVLNDWPQGEEEQLLYDKAMRSVMDAVSSAWHSNATTANGSTREDVSTAEVRQDNNYVSEPTALLELTLAQFALRLRRPQPELRELLRRSGRDTRSLDGSAFVSISEQAFVREALEASRTFGEWAWALEPGDVVRRTEIHEAYGGSRQSGIVTFRSISDIAIFTNLKSGSQFGYDKHEGLREDGSFAYTGQGQTGDQVFQRGNRALRDANANGQTIRLLAAEGADVTYVGSFATGAPTYWTEPIPDSSGNDRTGIIFNLVPVDASNELLVLPDTAYTLPTQKEWSPPKSDDIVIQAEGTLPSGERTVSRVEFELQRDFGLWLRSKGTAPTRLELVTAGTVIEPDLYVPSRSWIVEAKKSTAREYVRSAIGQVLDYAHIARRYKLEVAPVILLPGWPVRELIELAQELGIAVIVRDGDGFIRLLARTVPSATSLPEDQDLPIQTV